MIDYNDEIVAIEQLDVGDMIDITVSDDHLFIANDILTNNSIGTVATADMMCIYGDNDDDMIYSSELWYKIVKNRLGGRVGTMDKFFLDTRSLKMYDSIELDKWIEDAHISGDERKMAEIPEDTNKKKKKKRW